ncbi:ADP-ribosyl cyclase/cyclic ADP-ribose hydrolase-like [Ptychodera flava]|uniref:ADP-ribosyl cyclase/cyclic ADP-ribose hydrolase-like n=1 Tax=Ptychodera flava TaxID=63121 RepID=UPI00396A7B9E
MESAASIHFMIVLALGASLPYVTYCSHFTVSSQGTPKDIENTITQRCDAFNTVTGSSRSCQGIWKSFTKAFERKGPCKSDFSYSDYFKDTKQTIPSGKTLLWSGVQAAAMDYSEKCGFVTLGDTLTGCLLTDLTWCGKEEDPGINYETCDTCRGDIASPSSVFWRQASKNLASESRGVVSVMLSGSN